MDWKKKLINIAKIAIIAGSLLYICHRLWIEYQSGVFASGFQKLNGYAVFLLIITFVLVFVNWFIEAIKWKLLLIPVQDISLSKALKSVFAGITVSIFTPNRFGEFGGRVLILNNDCRIQGIFATLIGNMAQTLITIISGLLFFPFFVHQFSIIERSKEVLIFAIALTLTILGFLAYFKMKKLVSLVLVFKWAKPRHRFFDFIQAYTQLDLIKPLLLSALRYWIFSFQFYLLLYVFGVHISYTSAIMAISLVYFLMSFIPTYAFSELGVRGSVAVLIIGAFSPLSSAIISASIVLWVINLALPAIIGAIFLSKFQIK